MTTGDLAAAVAGRNASVALIAIAARSLAASAALVRDLDRSFATRVAVLGVRHDTIADDLRDLLTIVFADVGLIREPKLPVTKQQRARLATIWK